MKKCIILTVKPQWLEKILNGEKTIDIRKSMPKDCEYPIDVYLYCTKDKNDLRFFNESVCKKFNIPKTRLYTFSEQKGYTRFIVDESQSVNGKIVAKFTLNKVERFDVPYPAWFYEIKEKLQNITVGSRLSLMSLHRYLRNDSGYAWHIDNLEIFDKPMELGEFAKVGCKEVKKLKENNGSLYYFDVYKPLNYSLNPACRKCKYYNDDFNTCNRKEGVLTRPFQSWGYAYLEE